MTCSTGRWTKTENERILVGKDWTLDLNGATIDGDPLPPVITPGSGLVFTFAETEENVTKYWLEAGNVGFWQIILAINTSEGELLEAIVPVSVTAG